MPTTRQASFSIFLFFAGLYLLTLRGTHESVDDIPRYNLTISLMTEGTIEIPPSVMAAATTVDGRVYGKYGIGLSLVLAPLWLAGEGAARIAPEPLLRVMERPIIFMMSTANQWLGAAACAVLFLIVARVGFRERTALLIALAAGLGSMLWLNAQTSFENILGVLLIGIVVVALIGEGPLGWGAAAAAGAAMGYIFLTRWADGWIFLPGAIGLLATRLRRARPIATPAVAFALPLVAGVGLAMLYNYVRFSNPFELGYDDINTSWRYLPRGLFGFLFSPAKSIFVFTPLLIAAIASFGPLWRRLGGGLRAAAFFWLVGAPPVAYSCFETWDGGWCFGPRYLLPSVVLAMVALGEWIEDERRQKELWRTALFLLLWAVGVYAQWICLASNFNDYSDNYYVFRWYPEACPLWACPAGFYHPSENLWFWRLLASPGVGLSGPALLLVPLGLLLAGIIGLRHPLAMVLSDAGGFARQIGPAVAKIVLVIVVLAALNVLVRRSVPAWRANLVPEGAGLRATYFDNAHWIPPARRVETDAWLDFDWSRSRRPFQGDFSVRWDGRIEAPTSGTYLFGLDACGTATLALDGRLVIANPGPQPGRRLLIRSVPLTDGEHSIRMEFASAPAVDFYGFNNARYGWLRYLPTGVRLRWKAPNGLFLRLVPPRALRPG